MQVARRFYCLLGRNRSFFFEPRRSGVPPLCFALIGLLRAGQEASRRRSYGHRLVNGYSYGYGAAGRIFSGMIFSSSLVSITQTSELAPPRRSTAILEPSGDHTGMGVRAGSDLLEATVLSKLRIHNAPSTVCRLEPSPTIPIPICFPSGDHW